MKSLLLRFFNPHAQTIGRCRRIMFLLAWLCVIMLAHLDISLGDCCALYSPTSITNYKVVSYLVVNHRNDRLVALRSFSMGNEKKLLVVDPYTLETQIIDRKDAVRCNEDTLKTTTPYEQALTKYTRAPYAITNHGLKHDEASGEGLFLTIDMCPSSKPFEEDFFKALRKRHARVKTPISIAITGEWALHHPDEFDWLVKQNKSKQLDIVWINHTFHHRYSTAIPGITRDILKPKSALRREILAVEQLLLENGQIPSIFLRFPALISDQHAISESRALGLIPVGSDAWLAKGQKPNDGSIILVHGNANEPRGIKRFMLFMQHDPRLTFLPLAQSITDQEHLTHIPRGCRTRLSQKK